MDYDARLAALAKVRRAPTPVVSVYLNTRWADEHQRERVRVFLKTELRRARRGPSAREIADDLDWIQAQGESLIEQARFPEAGGVALFACGGLGLREILPVRVPFDDAFVVADVPFLRPLAAVLGTIPSVLVVFVGGANARLIPLNPDGPGGEVRLEATLEAATRGAVHRLYLLKEFNELGRACEACGALWSGSSLACRLCGSATRAVPLGEALVNRVVSTGGTVETIGGHPRLAGVGGLAARLRYPL